MPQVLMERIHGPVGKPAGERILVSMWRLHAHEITGVTFFPYLAFETPEREITIFGGL